MALITLIRRRRRARRPADAARRSPALGIFGASLFFGDSMITPAISVLSAVEGLKVVAAVAGGPDRADHRGDHRAAVRVQRIGTAAVGRLFGPVMIVWFVAIGACGVGGIADHPEILKALSPTYAVGFLVGHFSIAFFSLAAVVLAITGAEALYADMGHFGRPPITRAWLVLVFPACILSYLGQGALVLDDPSERQQPVLPAGARLGPAADGPAGHRGDGHRLAGGDHRRLLGGPPGRPARLPAAAADRPHLGADDRPDLRPVDQLGADGLGAHPGVRVPRPRPRWPSRSGWRSPARSPSPRCCSSTSSATSGGSRCGWCCPAAAGSSPSTCCSSPRT